MATTIENFLIGIGIEYDKSGEKKALNAVKDIKSKALQLAAVLGGAFGVKALTIDTAKSAAQLERFAAAMGLSQQQVASFDSAVKQSGGTLEESRAIIESVTRTQDNLRKNLDESLRGELARIGVGADLGDIIKNAPDAEAAINQIVKRLESLDKVTQRKGLQILGLDSEALRQIVRTGAGELQATLSEATGRLRIDAQLGKDAEKFNIELIKMQENFGSIGREISANLLPPLTDFLAGMNDFIATNRDLVSSGIEDTTKVIADNFEAIAIALGIIAGAATIKGLTSVFSLVSGLGGILGLGGAAGGTAAVAGTGVAAVGTGVAVAAVSAGVLSAAGSLIILKELEKRREAGILPEERFNPFMPLAASRIPMGNAPAIVESDFLPSVFRPTEFRPELFREQAERGGGEAGAPIRPPSFNRPLNINLMMNGEVIGRASIEANEFDNTKTISEFITSTGA